MPALRRKARGACGDRRSHAAGRCTRAARRRGLAGSGVDANVVRPLRPRLPAGRRRPVQALHRKGASAGAGFGARREGARARCARRKGQTASAGVVAVVVVVIVVVVVAIVSSRAGSRSSHAAGRADGAGAVVVAVFVHALWALVPARRRRALPTLRREGARQGARQGAGEGAAAGRRARRQAAAARAGRRAAEARRAVRAAAAGALLRRVRVFDAPLPRVWRWLRDA